MRELPSATTRALDGFDVCVAHLRPPVARRRVIRTTDCSSGCSVKNGRRIVISEFERKQIEELRNALEKE